MRKRIHYDRCEVRDISYLFQHGERQVLSAFTRRIAVTSFLSMQLLTNSVLATEPEYIENDESSTGIGFDSPMDYSFKDQVVFKRYRGVLDDRAPFFRDGTLDANIRSYWFQRDNKNEDDTKALALGGELVWNSGWYRDLISLQLAGFTSQPIYAPDSKDGTGLLQSGQNGYSVLGKANAQLKIGETRVRLYRSELNTPFANNGDIRMTPLLFENYTILSHDIERVDILASYVTKYKQRTSQSFKGLLEGIGSDKDSDMFILGGRYRPDQGFSIGAIGYHVKDYLAIGYVGGQADLNSAWGVFNVAGQYIHQQNTGKSLDGDINNNSLGWKVEYQHGQASWTAAWHKVSGDSVRKDWGSYPGYNSLILRDFNRANEESFRIGLNYEIAQWLEGLSFIGNFVFGDTPDRGLDQSPDEKELDLTLDYSSENHYFRHFNVRLRYAQVWQDYKVGNGNIKDLRFIINYQLPRF